MLTAGQVWKHSRFYKHADTGAWLPKYLVILAVRTDGDLVYKLLTSQAHQRPMAPACDKDGIHPGYYLGVPTPAGELNKPTWLDLRETEDFDGMEFQRLMKLNVLSMTHVFAPEVMCPAMQCAAYAPDTTGRQTRYIMDARAKLGCN